MNRMKRVNLFSVSFATYRYFTFYKFFSLLSILTAIKLKSAGKIRLITSLLYELNKLKQIEIRRQKKTHSLIDLRVSRIEIQISFFSSR